MSQRIEVIGRLVSDAVLKEKADGKGRYVSFRIASNEYIGGLEETTFFDVAFADKNRVYALRKGVKVFVRGRLRITVKRGEKQLFVNNTVGATELEFVEDRVPEEKPTSNTTADEWTEAKRRQAGKPANEITARKFTFDKL